MTIRNLFLLLIIVLGCDNDDERRFEGILLTDESNFPLGTKGNRDLNDWQNDGELDKEILELLDFATDVDLTGTVAGDVEVFGYPNPISDHGTIQFALENPSLVKLVIVNEDMDVLFSTHFTGTKGIAIDFSDEEKFPNQEIVRAYYSVSSEGQPNYFVGHGDIWICRSNCR
jgi:hypothetical protein